jgi:Lrp/AsnC family leucine-responsive transcriptional regulator
VVIENTKAVRRRPAEAPSVDAVDRKLLGLLATDATLSYAELGRALNLSPPAVHERVKRLKRDGVIKATVAALDGRKLGKSILAFIHVNTTGWGKSQEMLDLAQSPDVEEIHTVTGDTCVMLKVRTQDAQGLEDLLRVIYDIPGVQGTRSYIVLSSHLERGALPAD